jgi:putative flavoprotein involved in K+ transport
MTTDHERIHDTIIIGAGPAGIAVGAALRRIGVHPLLLDRHEVGASFRRWPDGMRLLTPSFTSNQFGAVDLNAVTPETSPAWTLLDEHPTGPDYARYLDAVVESEELQVVTGCDVLDVRRAHAAGEPAHDDDTGTSGATGGDDTLLTVEIADRPPLLARTVVWAAGEMQYPDPGSFPGAASCRQTITVPRWTDVPGQHLVVIGGYESGIDAAIRLIEDGRDVVVLDRAAPWTSEDPDPSRSLSPYTHGRLRRAHATGRLELVGDAPVRRVVTHNGGASVHTDSDEVFGCDGVPLLATGFAGSLELVRDRFAFDDGRVVVTEAGDESTVLPGLFLAGPMLAHRGAIFCFVYKFRQRAGVVARAIGERLERDTTPLKVLREVGFMLEDLSCCDDCAC